MDYFAGMRAFVRAVELGSFSRAAAEEGVKVSTVSRYVTALETDLGAALFNRSTRRLHLTEVGTTFFDRAVAILAEVADARLAATALNATPQGLLRINVPGAFGRRHVVPHLADFLAAFPDIQVDATLADETVDLIASGADVAVRIGALADSTLVAKRLAPQRRRLVAAPA
jgi:DNA-binding transcriptional LysR family regulator